jgi:hypothetical protein
MRSPPQPRFFIGAIPLRLRIRAKDAAPELRKKKVSRLSLLHSRTRQNVGKYSSHANSDMMLIVHSAVKPASVAIISIGELCCSVMPPLPRKEPS